MAGTPITTPSEAYKANDTGIPDAEKNQMIQDLGGALQSDLDTTNSNVADAQADATEALTLAGTAQATADAACPDDEAIKTTGAQTKTGVLTFTNFPVISAPASPTGNEVATATYVDAAIAAAVPSSSWNNLTLQNGWAGTAKYMVLDDYVEVWYNMNSTAATDGVFATISNTAHRLDHTMFFANAQPYDTYFSNSSTGNLLITDYSSSANVIGYHRMPRLAP